MDTLKENKKTRLLKLITGADYYNIFTVGILSAENPSGKVLKAIENKGRMQKLKKYLSERNFVFIQTKGMYDNLENSIVIQNIPLKVLVKLAREFEQESFIFGEIFEKEDKHGMRFEYWEDSNKDFNYQITSIRYTFKYMDDAPNYYTQYKGIKFQIPFFDEVLEEKVKQKGSISFTLKGISEKTKKWLFEKSKEAFLEDSSKSHIWRVRGTIKLILQRELDADKGAWDRIHEKWVR